MKQAAGTAAKSRRDSSSPFSCAPFSPSAPFCSVKLQLKCGLVETFQVTPFASRPPAAPLETEKKQRQSRLTEKNENKCKNKQRR